MKTRNIGYKWYVFKFYFKDNKIEVYNSRNYKLLKTINLEYSGLENILKNHNIMIKFFDEIIKKYRIS